MKPAWVAMMGSLGLAGCCCFLAVCASAEITKEPGLRGPSGTELPGPDWPWKKRAATLVPSFTKTTAHHTTTHHPRTTQHHTTTHHPTTTHHQHNRTTHQPTTTHHPTTTQHHTTTHQPTTTHHPTTTQHHTTTHHPTTTHHQHNRTTHHPSTTPHPTRHAINHTTVPVNSTTPPQPPAPTQSPVVPIGKYQAKNGSATCLLMQTGLQIQVRYKDKDKKQQQLLGAFAVQPNTTKAFGNCSSRMATLDLRFPEGSLLFTFLKNDTAKTFYLSRVQANLTYQFPQATETTYGADNSSLREFEAHLGHSYQCGNSSLALTPDFHLNTLQEHVQAFELKGDGFGPAEFCQKPRRPAIVPIVVGVVLGLLIVIVVVAYAVGRWRTQRGYQTI